jgi:diguanylate cyclase (GGDEF)-like protein
VAALAGPGLIGHLALARAAAAEQAELLESCAAALAAAHLARSDQPAAVVDAWLARLGPAERRVCWAALADREQGVVELRRRCSFAADELAAQAQAAVGGAAAALHPLYVNGRVQDGFVLLTIPHERGALAVALAQSPAPASGSLFWLFGAALAGVAAAWAVFVHTIERPLQQVARALSAVNGLSDATLGAMAPAEVHDLARTLQGLRTDLERWHGEATSLRFSLDQRVDARTRRAEAAQRRAELEAETDALTRLENRRGFEREMPALFAAAQTGERELAVVMIDLDRLKLFNDQLGHPAGDRLLAFTGDLIRATIRRGLDRGVRLGGDEFLLLLPDTSAGQAEQVARRLAALFAQRAQTLPGSTPPPGLSAGVAERAAHKAKSWPELLQLADAALYAAKRAGGGVVQTAGPETAQKTS